MPNYPEDYKSYEMLITCETPEKDFDLKKMWYIIMHALMANGGGASGRLLCASHQKCDDDKNEEK